MNTSHPTMDSLERRLLLLEQTHSTLDANHRALVQRHRSRGALLALSALVFCSMIFLSSKGQSSEGHSLKGQQAGPLTAESGVLKAKGFVLVDDQGKSRAELSLVKGHPSFALLNEEGVRCVHLSLQEGTQPGLMITDGKGNNRISLVVDSAGHPHLLMADSGNKPRIHMAVSERGAGSLMFIHLDGTMPSGLGVHADGRPWQRPATGGSIPAVPEHPVGPIKDEPVKEEAEQGR